MKRLRDILPMILVIVMIIAMILNIVLTFDLSSKQITVDKRLNEKIDEARQVLNDESIKCTI